MTGLDGGGDLVVVSVGTDHHPFNRLMGWVESWLARPEATGVRCVVQAGTSRPPSSAISRSLVPHDELMDLMRQARGVVTHGGPATILDAREAGHVPIVVPRRRSLGEHVDDHQVAFCRRVSEEGLIKLAATEDELFSLLDQARRAEAPPAQAAAAPGIGAFIACAQRLLLAPPRHAPIRLMAHRLP